ncbi:MAG: DUF4040 domain-containing protein [Ignisphaera sp.]|uniref:DUF4040 domain-containing protein n=1 Tax=Ignisphaera aggregans TaxID=334771 RepID=A0A7J3MXV6_9CREN
MILPLLVVLIASFFSVVAAYLTVVEKDLLTAVVYLSLLGVCYTIIYYVLMAPDIALVYIPISTVILPVVLIIVLRKTKRYEE